MSYSEDSMSYNKDAIYIIESIKTETIHFCLLVVIFKTLKDPFKELLVFFEDPPEQILSLLNLHKSKFC